MGCMYTFWGVGKEGKSLICCPCSLLITQEFYNMRTEYHQVTYD